MRIALVQQHATADREENIGRGLAALERAKKEMIEVRLRGNTIPHEVVGKFGASRVVMRPAREGTGVIAGGTVRAVMEAAGVKDVLTKALGSRNPHNLVKATLQGLRQLRDLHEVARARGKSPQEVLR